VSIKLIVMGLSSVRSVATIAGNEETDHWQASSKALFSSKIKKKEHSFW
jgi:hypothetical protein